MKHSFSKQISNCFFLVLKSGRHFEWNAREEEKASERKRKKEDRGAPMERMGGARSSRS